LLLLYEEAFRQFQQFYYFTYFDPYKNCRGEEVKWKTGQNEKIKELNFTSSYTAI